MNAKMLLETLRAEGVDLAPDGDRLHYRAPAGAMTPELLKDLAANKAEVLKLLREEAGLAKPAVAPEQKPQSHRDFAAWVRSVQSKRRQQQSNSRPKVAEYQERYLPAPGFDLPPRPAVNSHSE